MVEILGNFRNWRLKANLKKYEAETSLRAKKMFTVLPRFIQSKVETIIPSVGAETAVEARDKLAERQNWMFRLTGSWIQTLAIAPNTGQDPSVTSPDALAKMERRLIVGMGNVSKEE